jgi:O-antigen ligase
MLLLAAGLGVLAWRPPKADRPAAENLRLALAAFCGLLPLYLWRGTLAVPGLGNVPTTALELMLAALFGVWLWRRGRTHAAWNPWLAWWKPLALFALAGAVSVLVAADWRAGLGLFRAYIAEPILFFAVFLDLVRTRDEARRVMQALSVTVIIVGVTAVWQKITGDGIPNPYWQAAATRRVTAFYGFPNAIGLFVAPLVVLLFGEAWEMLAARRWQAAFLPALAALLGVLAAVFAVSQGAMLGMAVGLFLLGLTRPRLRLPTLTVAAIVLIAILAVPTARHKAVELMTLADDSGSVRRVIWSETLTMLADRPIFGAGLSGYQEALAPYHDAKRGIEIYMYPHSWPLNFWTEMGLAGLAAFVWIIIRFARRSWTAFRKGGSPLAAAALCAMAALLVHGLVDAPYFKNDLALLFWIIVGVGMMKPNPPLHDPTIE